MDAKLLLEKETKAEKITNSKDLMYSQKLW